MVFFDPEFVVGIKQELREKKLRLLLRTKPESHLNRVFKCLSVILCAYFSRFFFFWVLDL